MVVGMRLENRFLESGFGWMPQLQSFIKSGQLTNKKIQFKRSVKTRTKASHAPEGGQCEGRWEFLQFNAGSAAGPMPRWEMDQTLYPSRWDPQASTVEKPGKLVKPLKIPA